MPKYETPHLLHVAHKVSAPCGRRTFAPSETWRPCSKPRALHFFGFFVHWRLQWTLWWPAKTKCSTTFKTNYTFMRWCISTWQLSKHLSENVGIPEHLKCCLCRRVIKIPLGLLHIRRKSALDVFLLAFKTAPLALVRLEPVVTYSTTVLAKIEPAHNNSRFEKQRYC